MDQTKLIQQSILFHRRMPNPFRNSFVLKTLRKNQRETRESKDRYVNVHPGPFPDGASVAAVSIFPVPRSFSIHRVEPTRLKGDRNQDRVPRRGRIRCFGSIVYAFFSIAISSGWAQPDGVLSVSSPPLSLPPETRKGSPQIISVDPVSETQDLLCTQSEALRFWDAGVYGQDASVANIEGGHAWSGHETLEHLPEENWFTGTGALGTITPHATATTQLTAGLGPTNESGDYYTLSLGMAPLVDMYSGDMATAHGEAGSFSFSSASLFSVYDHFFGHVDVINSSWGRTEAENPDRSFSGSDDTAIALDAMARANPHTMLVVSAGNDGENGTNTVTAPASGFNTLSVGALSGPHSYETVADFSSRGPGMFYHPESDTWVPDVRAAVDLCAPGTTLGAAYTTTETSGYYTFSGTSASAPVVSGGIALMASASRMLESDPDAVAAGWSENARDARVLKATLLSTAERLSGWSNNSTVQNGIEATFTLGNGTTLTQVHDGVHVTPQGLDYTQGAGRVNFDRAFDSYTGMAWLLDNVEAETDRRWTFSSPCEQGEILTATLAWFADRQMQTGWNYENPEEVILAEESLENAALANLNLELWDDDFSTLYAVSNTPYGTTEHLVFTVVDPGSYALRITHDGMTIGEPDETETYALAWQVIPEPMAAIPLIIFFSALFVRHRIQQMRGEKWGALVEKKQRTEYAG